VPNPEPPVGLAAALADHYTIERELGHGGMATVYLAHDLKHDREVALKVLRPELAAVLGRERFLAEIRLTARLDHPHILTLIDSGEVEGFLYYVLPYIRGESLRQKLERERQLRVQDAVVIARQIAGALEYAHQHGIIHRDIKPENILLHEGEAMLADFGIALAIREAGGERLTETGLSVGTPQYMSPEQATAERQLDARSDIYSLGAVLYEMLAGEPPFTGATGQAVIAKLMTERPTRLRNIRDTVPDNVDGAVLRALAKVPADRYLSAAEFAAALAASTAPVPVTRRLARWAPLALGLVVAGAAAAVLLLGRSDRGLAPVTLRRFTSSGLAGGPHFSPDGRRIVYSVAGRSLVVQPVDGGDPIVLVPSSRFLQEPRWTRDGTAILFQMFRDSLTLAGTWMVPSTGGALRQVLDDQDAFDAGPDSTVALRYQRPPHTLELVDLRTGRAKARFPLPDSVAVAWGTALAWSPDTKLVAIAGGRLWVLHLADSSLHLVAPEGASPRWDAAGRYLYFLAGPAGAVDLWRVRVDGRTGAALGAPARVLGVPRARVFDLGPNGELVTQEVTSTTQAHVGRVAPGPPPRFVNESVLSTGSASVATVAISDDGETVALTRELSGNAIIAEQGKTSHRFAVDLMPFGGGPARTLSSASISEFAPRFAPDGRRLTVLRSDSGGDFVTLVSTADGTARRLGTRPAVGTLSTLGDAVWSADGSRVVYLVSSHELVIIDPEQLTEKVIPIPDSIGAAFNGQVLSPYGDQVAVSTIRRITDWAELWLVDAATGRWHRAVEPFGNSIPLRWSTDGTIYVESDRAIASKSGNAVVDVWAVHPDGRPPQFVTPLPEGCRALSISADGHRVACVVTRDVSDILMATDFAASAR
jgi:Tol biopolymer transport system component